jgi:hypothetical protein
MEISIDIAPFGFPEDSSYTLVQVGPIISSHLPSSSYI